MEADAVKSYFERAEVVADYARAVDEVGLWKSEEAVICSLVPKDAAVLELGCGAGRIGINLARRGYSNVLSTDFSENMVKIAEAIGARDGLKMSFAVCDATATALPDESFDAAIFGFNGLMQIPKAENRKNAVREIFRVLKSGGIFVFTTHDREVSAHRRYWESEEKQWAHGVQDPRLDDFGDIYYKGEHGNIFIHSPSKDEVAEMLERAGFETILAKRRSEIAQENASVEEFSDDCIFWAAKKPAPAKNL